MRKLKVLFICVGNSCRSQMAEGFARTYGSDVLVAESVGLAPAPDVAPLTREVMLEKNIDVSQQFPKGLFEVDLSSFDLVVNISGVALSARLPVPVREWDVSDPIGAGMTKRMAIQFDPQSGGVKPAPS